jgi:hypothetical protein
LPYESRINKLHKTDHNSVLFQSSFSLDTKKM